MYFCLVLFASAVLSAPWPTPHGAGLLLAATGALGILYTVLIALRARRQKGYQPELEDWIWHVGLPCVAHVLLLAGAVTMHFHVTAGLFMIAGTSLLLLFIGIHNAWDTVIYIAVKRPFRGGGTT